MAEFYWVKTAERLPTKSGVYLISYIGIWYYVDYFDSERKNSWGRRTPDFWAEIPPLPKE